LKGGLDARIEFNHIIRFIETRRNYAYICHLMTLKTKPQARRRGRFRIRTIAPYGE
jgi:hypothetical protein